MELQHAKRNSITRRRIMGGWLPCAKCDKYFHTHDGGEYINGESYCEYCACELEAYWLLKEEE